jgi:hypothetical protein
MNAFPIFVAIYCAMIAMSFWEAYVEGKHAWAEGKLGWKLHYHGYIILTAYHFWLSYVMIPALLSLPFVIYGFDLQLFGIMLSAYASGLVVEDFFWFVVNPTFKMKNWDSKHVTWYPWLNLGFFEIPAFYIVEFGIALTSWFFLWR